jgi:hypothetical protein
MDFINSLWNAYGASMCAVAYILAIWLILDFVAFKWKKKNPDKSYKGRFVFQCAFLLILHWIGWL